MKLSHWFLILLTAFGVVILLILISEPPEFPTGKPHEKFPTMAHSGSSVIAIPTVKWLAYLFGLGIIGVFGFAATFGARKAERLKGIKPWLFIGVIAYLLVFTILTLNYWDYAEHGSDTIFGGVPMPTALMLYGLGAIPFILTFVYILKFRTWILTEEDEKQFQEILKRRKLKN